MATQMVQLAKGLGYKSVAKLREEFDKLPQEAQDELLAQAMSELTPVPAPRVKRAKPPIFPVTVTRKEATFTTLPAEEV